jgi:orotate phosphoribosyltransferase
VVEFPEVVKLARPRSGHFDLGTGYHGDLWLDLDALLLRPPLLRPHIRWLAERLREHSVDAVCGPLEGGAFLAYAVADLLGAAFLAGYRSPGEATGYHLPAVQGGIGGWRVGVVDDAVNAGTAVAACLEEVRGRGAVPVAVAALVSLGEASAMVQARMRVPFYPASTVPSRAWPAERCPLCAEGAPYTDPLSGDVATPLPAHPRPPKMTSHEESDAPRSQDSVTGGAGGPAVSHACSVMISGPGFFLDLGKARLLVNSSPQPGGPACKARSIIGLKSFTFSVSNHRFSALAHANISSSDLERRSGRSATAITSWPSPRSSAAMAGENISSSRSLTSGRWFMR